MTAVKTRTTKTIEAKLSKSVRQQTQENKNWGIVPFMTTPLKGRFVVYLKWLLIDYFRFG